MSISVESFEGNYKFSAQISITLWYCLNWVQDTTTGVGGQNMCGLTTLSGIRILETEPIILSKIVQWAKKITIDSVEWFSKVYTL